MLRSVPEEKCSVFLNHVDPAVFYRRSRTRNDGKFIIIFPGSFQWHQGLDIAIEAFALIRERVPSAEFHIYGEGPMEAEWSELVVRRGLQQSVKFCGRTSLSDSAEAIANADMGVVPKRADSFGNEAYSTKIMEFMSQGVPVIASRTKIDTYYFSENSVRFFKSGDARSMADAMLDVMQHNDVRDALVTSGYQYVERHGWHMRKMEYFELVDTLSTENFDDSDPRIKLTLRDQLHQS